MSIRGLSESAANIAEEVRLATGTAATAEQLLRDVGDERGAEAAVRCRRAMLAPATTIVIAGEYQKGKSSLLNALLGARVSPTDPLTTTTVPIRVRLSAEPGYRAHVAAGDAGPAAALPLTIPQFERLATTVRPTLEGRDVVGLQAAIDHPMLRTGLALLDTPPVSGGLSTATAGMVLGLLQSADAIIFVTDASQELTAPEIEFIRMARSLCPFLMVALTKTDLYPQWRRILDVNQEFISAIDPDAVVLPASPQLRMAAVRTGDAELDRESGVPVMSWYLGTTLLAAARRSAIARTGVQLTEFIGAGITTVEQRVAVLEESAGLRDTQKVYEDMTVRVERLRSEAPRRVRLELRSFVQATRNDLVNRFTTANEAIAEFVNRTDPADEWPEIEASLHRAANRAMAEHMIFLHTRAEGVVTALVEAFGLEQGLLQLDIGDAQLTNTVDPDLDKPDFTSSGGAARIVDLSRGSVMTGSMTFGLAAILTGGIAAVALAAGAAVGTGVLSSRREKTRDLTGRRNQALQVCRAWLSDARTVISAQADDMYKDLEFELESQIEKGLQRIIADTERERARLEQLSNVARELVPEEVRAARQQLDELRVVHAHARRIHHRLARPDLMVETR